MTIMAMVVCTTCGERYTQAEVRTGDEHGPDCGGVVLVERAWVLPSPGIGSEAAAAPPAAAERSSVASRRDVPPFVAW